MAVIRIDNSDIVTFIDFEGNTIGDDLIIVDEIPQITQQDGKIGRYIYNKDTNSVEVQYIDIPVEIEQRNINDRIGDIEQAIAAIMGGAV
jgi:hypothetical protein